MTARDARLNVRLSDGSAVEAEVSCSPLPQQDVSVGESYRMELHVPGIGTFVGCGSDYFNALCRVREQLATIGAFPLCVGARRDAYPSGMARSMGTGLRVYITELGRPVHGPAVSIFEEAPADSIASVDDQRIRFEEWINSLATIHP